MKPKFSALLPLAARMQLIEAAEKPNTRNDPLARKKAVEAATERVKQQYPEYFQQEQEQ